MEKQYKISDAVSLDWNSFDPDWDSADSSAAAVQHHKSQDTTVLLAGSAENADFAEEPHDTGLPAKKLTRAERRAKKQHRSCTNASSYHPDTIRSGSKFHR